MDELKPGDIIQINDDATKLYVIMNINPFSIAAIDSALNNHSINTSNKLTKVGHLLAYDRFIYCVQTLRKTTNETPIKKQCNIDIKDERGNVCRFDIHYNPNSDEPFNIYNMVNCYDAKHDELDATTDYIQIRCDYT